MKPRTKEQWITVLDWIDWFMRLLKENEPERIEKAINAAKEAIK